MAIHKLFYAKLKRESDDLPAFRSQFDQAVGKVRRHKVELPAEALGFLFIRQAGVFVALGICGSMLTGLFGIDASPQEKRFTPGFLQTTQLIIRTSQHYCHQTDSEVAKTTIDGAYDRFMVAKHVSQWLIVIDTG